MAILPLAGRTIPDKTGCLASPHPDIQHSACPVVGRVWVEETETNGVRFGGASGFLVTTLPQPAILYPWLFAPA